MKISIDIKQAALVQKEIIFGIDLGTTNSLIAYTNDAGQAETLKEAGQRSLVPSIIHFNVNEKIEVGDEALPFLLSDTKNTVYSVKRLMGKSYRDIKSHENYFGYKIIDDDTEKLVKIRVGDTFYSPVELSSFILKALKERAERILNTSVKKVVITVPAYFNDAQRQATRDAGKLAGLEVLRIIHEPTAASLAYGIGLNREEEKTIAVYDLGGGTFDVSVLKIHDGIFEVLSTHGDTFLGGDDFDKAIVDHWLKENDLQLENDEAGKIFSQQLRLLAEKAKKELGTKDNFTGVLNENIHLKIDKNSFEKITEPLVAKTMDACKKALKDADLDISQIDVVVMAGGATRIPAVKNAVGAFFQKEVYDKLNPDEVVALGAAIQADVLAGKREDVLLLDITPLSLGIETMGGLMDVLIPRNAKIPTKASRQYTTSTDGQKNIRISVYQGERDLISDNRKLAEFVLSGLPAMPAGLPKVEISFMINADGILSVKATELRSGLEQSIEVKPQYGLTDEEVEKMLLDSIQHAKEDIATRAILEAITEGKQMVRDTEKFMEKNMALLSEEEKTGTISLLKKLEQSFETKDKDLIHARLDELNEYSTPYAHRVMAQSLAETLKGKKI